MVAERLSARLLLIRCACPSWRGLFDSNRGELEALESFLEDPEEAHLARTFSLSLDLSSMTTLLGTECSSIINLGVSSTGRFLISPNGVPSLAPSVAKGANKSSFWGSSSTRLSIASAASDSSRITEGSALTAIAALLEEQQRAPKGTTEATSPAVTSSAEETSSSYSSGVNERDIKAWRAIRASRKTSRRRALAFTLALAGLSGRSSEAHDQSSDASGQRFDYRFAEYI